MLWKRELIERALKIKESFFVQDHPEVATTWPMLGMAEYQLGRVEAKKILEKAAEILSLWTITSRTITVREMLSKITMLQARSMPTHMLESLTVRLSPHPS